MVFDDAIAIVVVVVVVVVSAVVCLFATCNVVEPTWAADDVEWFLDDRLVLFWGMIIFSSLLFLELLLLLLLSFVFTFLFLSNTDNDNDNDEESFALLRPEEFNDEVAADAFRLGRLLFLFSKNDDEEKDEAVANTASSTELPAFVFAVALVFKPSLPAGGGGGG